MSRKAVFVRSLSFLAALALLFPSGTVQAQQQASALPAPRLMTVFPNGGKIGSTVEVAFTGTDVEEPDQLIFSHPGIKAEPVIPADTTKPDPKKPPMPAAKPAITKFKVTIAANVPVGNHDVRLVNKWGVSNARAFVVGDLVEAEEKEPNNDVPQAQKIEMNSTVNGSMASPTDVDFYTFTGKKGQRVIISCLASSIDSRFHPGVQLRDAKNRMLSENRNYAGTDALLDATLQEDGEFTIRVYHFTHTLGNAEYFYRMTISTAPWIDAVFPPMVEPGKQTQVTVYGRNLPGGQLDPTAVLDGDVLEKITMTVTPPTDPTSLTYSGLLSPSLSAFDGFELRVKNAVGQSNPYLLTYAKAPIVLENPANDTPQTAQTITVPCELAGRIEKRRDRDYYTFAAKKGDVLLFDLISERLGVDAYMYFIIRSGDGKQTIVQQEEGSTDVLSFKFYARTDDPAPYRFTAPADGTYQLLIGNKTGNILFGPRHIYRMRITPEQPDFRLIVLGSDLYRPGTCTVLKGAHEQMTVLAWRNDGFNGEIALTVEGLPKGVTCPPQVLSAGMRYTQLVLTGAKDAAPWTGEIKVKGTATIQGKPVVREARPGGVTWPVQVGQNFPRVARLERGLALAVRGDAPYGLTGTLEKAEIAQGTTAVLTLKLDRISPDFKQPLQVQLFNSGQGGGQMPNSLPTGLTVAQGTIAPGQSELKVNIVTTAATAPGTYNVVLKSQAQIPYAKDATAKTKPNVQVVLPTNAVALTIMPKSLATLTLSNANVSVKAGATSELVVRVQRQFNFDGEFKVEAILPPGTQGVTIAPGVIKAGESEVKLMVVAAAGAKVGAANNINIKATAMFNGKTPVVHETKLNVNVTK